MANEITSGEVVATITGIAEVQGDVAAGAADSGNPVKVGGIFQTTLPTLANGQRGNLELSVNGAAMIAAPTAAGGDGVAATYGFLTAGTSASSRAIAIMHYSFNGSTIDQVRIANVFKTATATAAGDTAVWTPTSGKKFRLMAYQIQMTAQASQAAGGNFEVVLRDATTGLAFAQSYFVPGAAGTTFREQQAGWQMLTNGYLSTTANNVLNVNLSAALTAGEVRVVAIGTEE